MNLILINYMARQWQMNTSQETLDLSFSFSFFVTKLNALSPVHSKNPCSVSDLRPVNNNCEHLGPKWDLFEMTHSYQ